MSMDAQYWLICDHVVDGYQYEEHECPRCYGKGYYLDIYFDSSGNIKTCTESIKLRQDILKSLLDDKGSNVFHESWGSELFSLVGTKNLKTNKTKIEYIIRQAIEYYKKLQSSQNIKYSNLSPGEILDDIAYIEITQNPPMGYKVELMINNSLGEITSVSFFI